MGAYVTKRIGQMIVVVIIVSAITFTLVSLAPGGIAAFAGSGAQGLASTPEEIDRLRHIYGLDDPLPVQFARWTGNLLQGNMGLSYQTSEPVAHILARTVPFTVVLMLTAILLALLISIPIGVLGAYRPNSLVDYVATFLAFIGVSVPTFWLALVAILVFGVILPIFPTSGIGDPTAEFSAVAFLHHLILPATALSLPIAGAWTRFIRSSMLSVLSEDYIRTARAKGQRERVVLLTHALRNGLLPVITLVGITIAYMISNVAVVEYIFQWPGLGQSYIVAAISNRDLPLIMGALIVVSIFTTVGSLLADLTYSVADPRIRLT
jgi:peptide/nickel transport system permease protein